MVRRARTDRVRMIGTDDAIEAEGREFCSDAGATSQASSAGCEHAGCACHG